MAKKNTTARTNGANKNQKKNAVNSTAETQTNDVVTEISNSTPEETEAIETPSPDAASISKKTAQKKPVNTKTAKPKPAATKQIKNKAATSVKKIKLVSSCYHYYRNVLRDWLRDHKVPSARFLKNPENYDGYITVLENEKAQAVKALAQYRKENPDVKDLWKELRK